MLNELHNLNNCMEEAGILKSSWHDHWKQCPKSKTFVLLIPAEGATFHLQPVKDDQQIQKFRKYEVANGVSFPAFNVQPLLHAGSDQAKDSVKRLKELMKHEIKNRNEDALDQRLDELWEACEKLWLPPKEVKRINSCLQSGGLKEKLGDAINAIPDDYRGLRELVQRSQELTADDLQRMLKCTIREAILKSGTVDEWIETLLVSTANQAKKFSVVLELADRSSFPYPVNHEKVYAWVNAQLFVQRLPGIVRRDAPEVDAFGKSFQPSDDDEKFPSVNLPIVGKVILRAMSSESPCQKRYGRIDAKSFPAGKDVRQAMKDALEWLGCKDRKWSTWANASGVCGFTKRDGKKVPVPGLFLVHPSSLGEDPPELAGFFFRQDEAPDPDGAKFESAAARVTSALKTVAKEQPNLEVRVFVLAKADKARTKILVSKQYDAHALTIGAREWLDGCKNIPLIRLNIGTTDKARWLEPEAPFPAEVVECLNVAWFQNGQRTDLIHGLAIGEGIELLLGSGSSAQRIVQRALHLAIINASPMLLALGHADHRRDSSLKLDPKYKEHANLLPCLLGLLLHKQDHMKGAYMHKAPFLVGRLLTLADILHKEYCLHVRKGDPLPQLIGNALMSAAIDNPIMGLARLQQRLMIYQAWANTALGEGFGLAKWVLTQMGNVSHELALLDLPDRTNDEDKAQMLLGYLARAKDKKLPGDNDAIFDLEKEVSNV